MSRTEEANGRMDKAIVNEALMVWRAMTVVTDGYWERDAMDVRVDSITVRAPKAAGEDFLAVVKGSNSEGRPFVAFRSGPDVKSAMVKVAQGIEQGTITWKEDKPLAQK
jgi:hypothetical protein